MIAFFLAAICFLLTIPLKAIIMGYELKQLKEKKGKSLFEKLTPNKMTNLMSRIGVKSNNKDDKKSEDSKDPKQKAKKVFKEVVVASLKGLIVFLRALASTLTSCGVLGIIIILVVFVVVVASVAGVFSLMQEGGFLGAAVEDNNNSGKSGKTKTQQESNVSEYGIQGTGQTQVFTDNSTWVACCTTMFDWYYANIHTYQADSYYNDKGEKVPKRHNYSCDLVGAGVGDDCSGYVSAVLVYAGFLPQSGLYNYGSVAYKPDGAAAQLISKYFNMYTHADYVAGNYTPRPGDILVMTGHVEIIASVDPVMAYSWGSVPKSNPVDRSFVDMDFYLRHGYDKKNQKKEVFCVWALKDDVVPNTYLEGKTVTDPD